MENKDAKISYEMTAKTYAQGDAVLLENGKYKFPILMKSLKQGEAFWIDVIYEVGRDVKRGDHIIVKGGVSVSFYQGKPKLTIWANEILFIVKEGLLLYKEEKKESPIESPPPTPPNDDLPF